MIRFVLICICFLFGCSSQPSDKLVGEHDDLQNLKKSENYLGLIKYYKSKLVDKPQDEKIRLDLVDSYLKYYDEESANFYLDYDFSQEKSLMMAPYYKGKLLAREMDYQASRDEYLLSLNRGNRSKEIYLQLGIVNAQIGDYEQAIDYFNLSRSKGADDTIVKNNLAVVYIYKRDYERATEILNSISLDNKNNKKVTANLKIAEMGLNRKARKTELKIEELFSNKEIDSSKTESIENGDVLIVDAIKRDLSPVKARYSIQIAAFKLKGEAEKEVRNSPFNQSSIKVKQSYISGKGTWYRVLIGEFSNHKEARDYISKNKAMFNRYEYFIQVL